MTLVACLILTAAVVAAYRTGRAAHLPPAFTTAAALLAASLPGDPVSKFAKPADAAMPADPVERLRLTLSRYGFRVQSNVIFEYKGNLATIWDGRRGWDVADAARRVAAKTGNAELKEKLTAILEDM